ncbi:MAG TPA: hypothetical protein VGK26_06005 [Thermoanaerobaculia bacterium]|jgi:hypothetical protein
MQPLVGDGREEREPRPRGAGALPVLSVAALSAVLFDLLHEAGHLAATALPLGVTALSISTIGVSSRGSSAVVAAAGPAANLLFAFCLFGAFSRALSPAWRYFAWLFGTANLFNATAYLIYSAASGTGDWAFVFDALARPVLWRPLVGVAGCGTYAAGILASAGALRALCAAGIVAKSDVERLCALSYVGGGLVLTAGAVFNPVSPWYILTSGAATGFGAMAGLMLLPARLGASSSSAGEGTPAESLDLGWPWVVAGLVATVVFVGVFGPGVRLGR